jgi:hypothetical protein
MFCPRCGQQAAEEVRFCSRCGLPLDAAAELVEAGGLRGPELTRGEASVGLTPRQRGARKGLLIVAGGGFFFAVAALLTAFRDELFPFLILAGLVITAGVMRLLYGLLLEEHAPAKETVKPAAELPREQTRAAELPPARAVHASAYAKPDARTADMAAPLSVTENTTRLLDEAEPGRRP